MKRLLLCSLVLFLLAGGATFTVVVNTTASFPKGIYIKIYGTPHKGDLVLVCPEDNAVSRFGREHGLISSGVCLGSYGYLIKRIEAQDGDCVSFSAREVRVNGQRLRNSTRQNSIPSSIEGEIELHGQVLLMSEHPLSFDSRYFGPISTDNICTPLKPLFIWE